MSSLLSLLNSISAASESKTLFICAKHTEGLHSWARRLIRAEIRTEQRVCFCELPDAPSISSFAHSTNDSDEETFDDDEALLHRAHQLQDRDETYPQNEGKTMILSAVSGMLSR